MRSGRAISALVATAAVCVGAAACSTEGELDEGSAGSAPVVTCGPGTRLEGDRCVADDAGSGGTGGSGGLSSSGGTAGTGSLNPRCSQPLESGECAGVSFRFGFDVALDQCRRFVYGGCGGNDNRFATLGECIDTCAPGTLDRCDASDECEVISPPCCPPCEPVAMDDLMAVHEKYTEYEWCPGVLCGACEDYDGIPESPNFGARCVNNRCEVFDVRETELGACGAAADCRIRMGLDCCEGCGYEGPWVAVNVNAELGGVLCDGGPASCPTCDAVPPDSLAAACIEGRCTVVEGVAGSAGAAGAAGAAGSAGAAGMGGIVTGGNAGTGGSGGAGGSSPTGGTGGTAGSGGTTTGGTGGTAGSGGGVGPAECPDGYCRLLLHSSCGDPNYDAHPMDECTTLDGETGYCCLPSAPSSGTSPCAANGGYCTNQLQCQPGYIGTAVGCDIGGNPGSCCIPGSNP